MVNIIENWAEITGEIIAIHEDKSKPDFQLISFKILTNKNHRAFPNLVKPDTQQTITLKMKKIELKEKQLKAGKRISVIVRAAPANIYFADLDSIKFLK